MLGEVYAATHVVSGQDIAVKVLHREHFEETLRARLRRERVCDGGRGGWMAAGRPTGNTETRPSSPPTPEIRWARATNDPRQSLDRRRTLLRGS